MHTAVARKLTAAVFACAAAGLAGAQAPPFPDARSPAERRDAEPPRAGLGWGAATQEITRDRLASELIGTRVRNWKGQDLGRIEELIIDVNNARVHYAVLAYDEPRFGGASKLFAYPVQLLRQGTGDELILNVTQESLERAPGFERSRWPDWNDRAYREELDRYHGPTVRVQPRPDQKLRRASELIGMEIEDGRGRPVGEVRDVVADLGTAEVRYAVLDFAPSWGPADKMLALPLQSFTFPARSGDGLVLRTPRESLDLSRAFDEKRWPDFEDKAYRSGTDGFPGGPPGEAARDSAGGRR